MRKRKFDSIGRSSVNQASKQFKLRPAQGAGGELRKKEKKKKRGDERSRFWL